MTAKSVSHFLPDFEAVLPVTYHLLKTGNLALHEGVIRVFVMGSRGLDGTPRLDSDIDLSLHVDMAQLPVGEPERENFLRRIRETTLKRGAAALNWILPLCLIRATAAGCAVF